MIGKKHIMKEKINDIICWWSGGITSAVACKLAIDLYGRGRCRIIMIDTFNEHDDTYRFKVDCEKWYCMKIETITAIGNKYTSIQDVWRRFKSLNVATGAICSSELKREVRIRWQKTNEYTHQVFGFDINEPKRAKSMTLNYPNAKAIYPLLLHGISKQMSIKIVQNANIQIPISYKLGFHNNNCLKTGCVQGGIGYWQKMKRDIPANYYEMGAIEHELTDIIGRPVTMCRDQSKQAKATGQFQVFLIPHPNFPDYKCIDDIEGREPKPLFECNGFGCATNDFEPINKTSEELYHQIES